MEHRGEHLRHAAEMRQTRDVAEFANLLALPDEFVLLVHRPNGTCDTAARLTSSRWEKITWVVVVPISIPTLSSWRVFTIVPPLRF